MAVEGSPLWLEKHRWRRRRPGIWWRMAKTLGCVRSKRESDAPRKKSTTSTMTGGGAGPWLVKLRRCQWRQLWWWRTQVKVEGGTLRHKEAKKLGIQKKKMEKRRGKKKHRPFQSDSNQHIKVSLGWFGYVFHNSWTRHIMEFFDRLGLRISLNSIQFRPMLTTRYIVFQQTHSTTIQLQAVHSYRQVVYCASTLQPFFFLFSYFLKLLYLERDNYITF